MSNVRESKRKPLNVKLDVEKAADALVNYTYLISANKKVRESCYPSYPADPNKLSEYTHKCAIVDTGFDMIHDIKSMVTKMANKIGCANNIYGGTANQFKMRIKLEEEALELCYGVNSMITRICNIYHFASRKMVYWMKLNETVEVLLKEWIKSERKRCANAYENDKKNSLVGEWYDLLPPTF